MTIDRDDMIAHFSAYGDVTGISMNPTRGYAFIDYRTNECVQIALRYALLVSSQVLRTNWKCRLRCSSRWVPTRKYPTPYVRALVPAAGYGTVTVPTCYHVRAPLFTPF